MMNIQQQYHLNCRIFGNGSKKMIAFHGYGQDNNVYYSLASVMTDYTIYSLDLFFHGKSHWSESSLLLTPVQWKKIMEQFLDEHQIRNFTVVGFSMGGRVALSTLELFPDRIEEILLIAPDGVRPNPWYRMATTMPPFKYFFRKMASDDSRHFERLVGFVQKYKLVDPGVIWMAEYHMGTPALRKRVYNTWTLYNMLSPNLRKISGIINSRHIPISIFIGRHDKLITAADMRPLTSLLDKFNFQLLERGHYNMIGAVAEYYQAKKREQPRKRATNG